eukprot:Gb_40135 [translate_table: standard]
MYMTILIQYQLLQLQLQRPEFLVSGCKDVEFLNPQISRTSLVGIVGDIRQSMREEVDFQNEAANIDSFRKYVGTMGRTRQATIPKVYYHCSTQRVLTMEGLYGVPLTDLDSIRSLVWSPEASLITAHNVWFGSLLSYETFHAYVHAGNLWLLHDGWIGFLNFGIVGRISPNSRLKIVLDDEDMPRKWYNLIVDLPEPPPPALNPETRQPLKPKDFFPLFPNKLFMQEASQQRYIDIAEEVLEEDKRFRENRLEKMHGTPSRIYYKYEGVKSLVTETGVEQWDSSLAFACHLFDLQWRFILSKDPDSPGSLGIAVSEAAERALANADTESSLCSVLNHVLLHRPLLVRNAQMAILGETIDIIVDCTGGGAYVYNYADITRMTPLLKMHSLGHDFIPDPIHVGGLCYHGMAPLISHVYNLGLFPAPEPTHAIAAATREGSEILQHPSLLLLWGKAIQGGGTVMIPVVNKCSSHVVAVSQSPACQTVYAVRRQPVCRSLDCICRLLDYICRSLDIPLVVRWAVHAVRWPVRCSPTLLTSVSMIVGRTLSHRMTSLLTVIISLGI